MSKNFWNLIYKPLNFFSGFVILLYKFKTLKIMGSEVWANKETFLCGVSFNTKSELKRIIDEYRNDIERCKSRLKTLVFMTEPKKFYSEDEDVLFSLDQDFEELIKEYDELSFRINKLEEFEEIWEESHDKKTGKAVLPINPLDLKRPVYMGGDYMDHILEDGSDVPDDYWDVYHGFVKLENSSFYNKIIKNN